MTTLVLLDDRQSAHQRGRIGLAQLQAAIDVLPELVFQELAECEDAFEAVAVDFTRKLLGSKRGQKGKPASRERTSR